MIRTYSISIFLTGILFFYSSCTKVDESIQGVNPYHVILVFFDSWHKKDWKTLYTLVHPSIIQKIKMQKLTPKELAMSNEELFIYKFRQASLSNPDKVLRSYELKSISGYKVGDTTVWADTIVNGKKKRIPLTLDGLSIKVDLTRIE